MPVCTICGHDNPPGALMCTNCYMLFTAEEAKVITATVDQTKPPVEVEEEQPVRHRVKHTGRLGLQSIALYVEHGSEPLIIQLVNQAILGRYSPASSSQPRVDLTPYDALSKGVSRLHAAIRRTDDGQTCVVDLGSSNGTWLNGVRLDPQRPYVLRPGDRITLSQVDVEVYFEDLHGAASSGSR